MNDWQHFFFTKNVVIRTKAARLQPLWSRLDLRLNHQWLNSGQNMKATERLTERSLHVIGRTSLGIPDQLCFRSSSAQQDKEWEQVRESQRGSNLQKCNLKLVLRCSLTEVGAGTGQQLAELVQSAPIPYGHGRRPRCILVRDTSHQWDDGTHRQDVLRLRSGADCTVPNAKKRRV